eukprot:763984-Hanusia_phi.AAC.2
MAEGVELNRMSTPPPQGQIASHRAMKDGNGSQSPPKARVSIVTLQRLLIVLDRKDPSPYHVHSFTVFEHKPPSPPPGQGRVRKHPSLSLLPPPPSSLLLLLLLLLFHLLSLPPAPPIFTLLLDFPPISPTSTSFSL